MRSFISNFKERLRLPRLFFRKPSRAEQIHGGPPLEFERPIPPAPWRGIAVVITIVVLTATTAWELYCRSIGYGPTLNDSEDLWTLRRRAVAPESIVIIGDSRGWFDVDLDEMQKGLGKRPIQLAAGGMGGFPVLKDLADDENFHGTIICSIVPRLWFAPPGTPPMEKIGETIGARFRDTAAAIEKIRARGGKIVFVRFPHSGGLKELEDRDTPRAQTWDPLLKMTGAPGIYYSDFPELKDFQCPEWSHLSAGDSVEFSKRLVPHLRTALKM